MLSPPRRAASSDTARVIVIGYEAKTCICPRVNRDLRRAAGGRTGATQTSYSRSQTTGAGRMPQPTGIRASRLPPSTAWRAMACLSSTPIFHRPHAHQAEGRSSPASSSGDWVRPATFGASGHRLSLSTRSSWRPKGISSEATARAGGQAPIPTPPSARRARSTTA